MIGRIVVLLVIGFAISVAPTAAEGESSDESGGDCVYASSSSKGGTSAGVNSNECFPDAT